MLYSLYLVAAIAAGFVTFIFYAPPAMHIVGGLVADVLSWLRDRPARWRARRAARVNIRALKHCARLKGISPDELAMKMGDGDAKRYADLARRVHYEAEKNPTLGLDQYG